MIDTPDQPGEAVQLDVLVVGAGPTGLSLATELAAFGARFRIVDRHPDRVHESRALAIQPRTLEVLACHRIAEELVAAGNPAVRLYLHTRARVVSLRLFDMGIDDTAYPFLLFLSQAETERILDDHLHQQRGVRVERGVELVELDPTDNDVVTCQLLHPDGAEEILRARYVVGCDGAHSTVRQQAGIGFEGYRYPQTFLLADLEADDLEPDAVDTWLTDAGMLFFFPLRTPATFRMLAMRAPDDPDTPVTLDLLQAITDRYTGGRVRLHDPVWLSDFRLHNRGATHYRAGRMFLAGDAAHIHSPAGAQGMNTGIQDAANLGWKLALVSRGAAHPALLDTYEPERAPVGQAVRRLSDRAFTIATTRNPLLRLARTYLAPRVAPLALRFPRLRATAFRTISQLAIHYRSSPASTDGPRAPRHGPRAGDRLPDAPLTQDGHDTTLHTATAAPTYHLLLCGPANAWPANATAAIALAWPALVTTHRLSHDHASGVLHDPDGTALRRLGTDTDAAVHVLVRPDGHIAYRDHGTELAGVQTYLSRWLTTPGRRHAMTHTQPVTGTKLLARVGDARVAYHDEGSGDPVLLVHGCPFSSFVWRAIIPRLAGSYRCLAPDLRGLGDTETPSNADWSLPAQVNTIVGLLDVLGIDAAHVVGHDQGGAVAQLLAAYHPTRVRRLVLSNAEAYDNWPSAQEKPFLRATQLPILGSLLLWAWSQRPLFKLALTSGKAVHNPRVLTTELLDGYIAANLADRHRRAKTRRFLGCQLDPTNHHATTDALADLGRFDHPTLLVWGADDPHFGPEWAQRLLTDIPGATRLELLPDVGHLLMEEAPEQFAALVADFLNDPHPEPTRDDP